MKRKFFFNREGLAKFVDFRKLLFGLLSIIKIDAKFPQQQAASAWVGNGLAAQRRPPHVLTITHAKIKGFKSTYSLAFRPVD